MIELIIITILLAAVVITGSFLYSYYSRYKETLEQKIKKDKELEEVQKDADRVFLLMVNKWKPTGVGHINDSRRYAYAKYIAPDESKERIFLEAVKRQTLLSECRQYNVPIPASTEIEEPENLALVEHLSR